MNSPKKTTLECSVGLVTPQWAEESLKTNVSNRTRKDHHARFLAKEMREGRWEEDGAPIRFDLEGHLIDGQHRLSAVIEAGFSYYAVIVRGVPPKAFPVMDRNAIRTLADSLQREKVGHAQLIAPALYWLARHQAGNMGMVTVRDLSAPQAIGIFERNRDVQSFICPAIAVRKFLPQPLAIALFYLFSRQDPRLCEELMVGLEKGFAPSESDPFWLLRKKLEDNWAKRIRSGKIHAVAMCCMIIKAWNAKLNGVTLKVLHYRPSEEFPRVDVVI